MSLFDWWMHIPYTILATTQIFPKQMQGYTLDPCRSTMCPMNIEIKISSSVQSIFPPKNIWWTKRDAVDVDVACVYVCFPQTNWMGHKIGAEASKRNNCYHNSACNPGKHWHLTMRIGRMIERRREMRESKKGGGGGGESESGIGRSAYQIRSRIWEKRESKIEHWTDDSLHK